HATATRWIPLSADATFDAAAFRATLRSSMRPSGFVWLVEGGLDRATAAAPLSLWMGAGDGHARAPLLRAHPLLEDGILSGSVFGRHLTHTNAEVQRWIGSAPIRFAAASFVDVARAS